MKVRFYPKAEVVASLLFGRLADIKLKMGRLEAEIAKAAEPRAIYVDTTALRRELGTYVGQADDLQDQLTLLASHKPDEVMMELDIA